MINITLLSQVRSMFKLDPQRRSILVMLSTLFGSVFNRIKTSKAILAIIIPLAMAVSAIATPVIQTSPGLGAEVCVSSASSLTVVATAGGGGTVAYQWQRVIRSTATLPADTLPGASAWSNITSGFSGTYTAPTLLIGAGLSPLEDFYRCVLVETGGSSPGTVRTRAGYLTVVTGNPTFSVQPSNVAVCEGSAAQFFVTVNGPASFPHLVKYQWQVQENSAGAFNGSNATNANTSGSSTTTAFTDFSLTTTNSFTINAAQLQLDDQDRIQVVVSNVCGSSTTSSALLTVDPIPSAVIDGPATVNQCQSSGFTPSITVSNAQLSARRGSVNVNWTVDYTFYDGFNNATSNLTVSNTGNGSFNLSTLAALSPSGCYIWDISKITNTSSVVAPQCFKNLASQKQLNIYPNPVVSITAAATPVDQCEGSTSSFVVNVSNSTYKCNGAITNIPWTGTLIANVPGFGGCTNNCFSFTGSSVSGGYTMTGSGDGAFTITTSTLFNDDYLASLSAFATTGFTCPTTTVLPISKQIRSFPIPNANMANTTTSNTCEGSTIAVPAINVTNTVWQGPGAGATNLDWTLSTNGPISAGTYAATYTGTGNGAVGANPAATAPAVGCHLLKLLSISLVPPGAVAAPNHPTCPRTLSDQKTYNVYPTPVVSFTAPTVDVCEGSPASFTLTVSNASWTCNSVTTNMPWSATFASELFEGGAGGFSISPAGTGSGNGTFTFNTSNLNNNDYNAVLTAFTTTGPAVSCATSTGLPLYKHLRAFPIPDANMSTTAVTQCQSTSISTPAITVSNANWNGPGAGNTGLGYSLNITNTTSIAIGNPLTGVAASPSGIAVIPAFGPTVHTPGCYTLTLNSITLTNAGGENPPACPKTLVGQSKTWTVNPEPVVAIAPAGPSPTNRVNLCEGSGGSFTVTVSNSTGCSGNVNWSISTNPANNTFEAAANGSVAAASTAISSLVTTTGSGNGTQTVNIPNNLAPGQYIYTITGIATTGLTPNCTGSVTLNAETIYINVYPKPTIVVSPATETVCEGTAGAVTFTIDNTYYDPVGNSPISGVLPGNFTYSVTNALGGTIPSSPVTYAGSTGAIVSGPYSTSTTLVNANSPYVLTVNTINVDNPSCSYNTTTSNTYTLTVKKTPNLVINSVSTSTTCLNTTTTINYTVSNIDAGVNWSFTYSSTGFAGTQTVTGTGPVTGGTHTTPSFTSAGTHNLVFTPVTIVLAGSTPPYNTAPTCVQATAPANVPITIIPLPNVTALTATSASTFCSGATPMTWDVAVTNMVSGLNTYTWQITYNIIQTSATPTAGATISSGHTVTGTGNGTFGFSLPAVQRHFLANGDASTRQIQITKIEHTSASVGGFPLCTNNSPSVSTLNFTVEPMPRIDVQPAVRHICVTSKGTVNYTITGVRAGKTWTFKWANDNPSTTPVPITGSGSASGGGTGSFLTNSLSNVTPGGGFNAAGIYITDLSSTGMTCDSTSTYDDSTNFRVDPPSYADTLTRNWIVCEDNNSSVIRVRHPNLLVGSILGWDSSHDNGFTWFPFATSPPGTDSVNTFTNIRYTTQYRIRVKTPACAVAYSKVAQIFVDPRPKIQIVDNALTVCSGGNVVMTVLVTGVKSTDTWSANFTHTGTPTFAGPISGTGSGTFSFTIATGVTSGTHTIVLNSITNGITGCTNFPAMSAPSNTFTGTVATASVAGNIYLNTITAGNMLAQTVCKGTTVTLRHGNHAGSVSPTTTWFWSTSATPTYPNDYDSIVNNSSSLSVNTAGFPATTKYMVRVKSGSCNSVRSANFDLNTRILPTASFDAPRYKRICEGSTTSPDLTVTGSPSLAYSIGYTVGGTTGTLTGTTNGSGTHNTAITTPTLNASTNVIMQSIQYSTAPTCPTQLFTDAVSEIVVLKAPKYQMLTVDTPICIGNKTNYTYNIYDISTATGLTSATTTIDAREDGASAGAGTLISGISVSGNGAATKQTTNALGTAGTRFITITGAQTVYSFSSAPNTVTCTSTGNSAKSFMVWPASVAGTLTGTATVCKGSNSGSVTQSAAGTGLIVRWEFSINGGSTWSTITNTTTSQSYSNITVTTLYRAIYKSGNCAEAASSPITITVRDLPTATFTTGSTTICSGTTATLTNAISVSNTYGQTWTISYLEGTTTKTVSGTGDGTTTITTSTLTTNTDITLQSITMTHTATASNPVCGPTTLSSTVTVNVNVLPSVTLNSVTTPVCAGASTFATFQITTSNIAAGVGFTVTYNVGATTGLTYSNVGSGTFTVATTTPALTSAGTTAVTLTNITTTGLAVNCASSSSASLNITVDANSTAGTVTGTATVCKGANTGTVSVSGHNGTVVRWEFSTNGGSTWTTVSNTSTSLTYSNLTTSTNYRAITKNGSCAEIVSSNDVLITVNEQPTATISIASGNNPICANTNATYTVTTNNTYGQTWNLNVIEGSTARTVSGTGNTTTNFTTLSTFPTDATVSLVNMTTTGSPSCGPNNTTGNVSFTVVLRPNATINSTTSPICVGASANAVFAITTSNIATGVGFQLNYTVSGPATFTGTYTNTGSGTFTVTNTTALTTAGTYTVTLNSITTTGAAPNCSSSLSASRDIVVDATSIQGTVSPVTVSTVCKGSNSGSVTVGGHNGTVVRWEFLPTGSSTWTTVSNTSNVLSFSNLTVTTQYRAVTKNNSCAEITSTATTITVRDLPTASISGSTTICAGTTATLTNSVTVSNTFGNGWSISYLEGTTTKTLIGTGDGNFTITTSTLTTNTDITLQSITMTQTATNTNPVCGPVTLSGTITVNVNPLPTVTLNSVGGPICQGSATTYSVTVSNVPTGQGWNLTGTIDGVSITGASGTGSGTFTFNTQTLNTPGNRPVTLTLITNTTTSCTSGAISLTRNITVDETSTAGTVTPVTVSVVCKGSNSGSVSVAGHNGTVVRWEYLAAGSSTWTTVSNTSTTLSFTDITVTTQYRAVTKNGACNEINSSATTITVRDLPTASIAGSTTICAGTTATLTNMVTVANTYGNTWSIAYLEGTTSKTLTGTGDGTFTITTSTLTTNTDITLQSITMTQTATNTNPVCGPVTLSGTITINVNPLPTVTLNSVGGPICQGNATTYSITVSNVPTGQGWNVTGTIDAVAISGASGTGSGTFTFNTQTLSTPGNIPVVLTLITNTTTSCNSGAISLSKDIKVDATTVAGTTSGTATVCKGSNSGQVSYSGGNGAVVRWEYSVNGGTSWTSVGTSNSTHNYSNLTQTTMYRVIAKNGACNEAISSSTTITVRELPYATISGSRTICQNTSTTLDVTVSNSFGNPWTITYLEGTTTTSFSGTGDGVKTLTTNVLSTTSDITLETIVLTHSGTSSNPACGPNTLSSTATVVVTPLPTATLNSVTTPICAGSSSSFQFTVSNLATGQGWSMNYTEGATSKTTTGNGPGTYTVGTSVLSAGTVTITLNSISTTGLATNCTRNLTGQTMDITVNATTTVGALGTDVTVCKNTNSGNLVYNVGSSNGAVVRWESSTLSASGPWTAISNTTNTQSYLNISATTYYRVIVKNGTCAEKESNVITISVQEIPVATVSGSKTICAGNTTTLSISISNVAAGQRSILTYLEGAGTTNKTINIFGTSGTITTDVLNTNTDVTMVSVTSIDTTISAVFRKGCSNNALSSTATINVNALPTATLTSVGGPICQGSSTTYTVTVSNVPTGQGWSLTGTIEGVAITPAPTGTGSGTFTFNTPTLNNPTSAVVSLTKITNTTTSCERTISETKSISVNATTTVGTISGSTTVCKGSNSGSLTYTAGSGNGAIQRWEFSTVNSTSNFNGITNTASTQTYSNLTATTWYRAIVKNGVCNEVASNVEAIFVRELPNATIAGNATICEGSSTNFTLTVTNTFGQAWRIVYLIGSTQTFYDGTGDGTFTISTGVLTSTTDITLSTITQTSGSPQCSQTLSGTITITVNDLPKATYSTVPARLCQGSRISFIVDVSKVKSSQNWTLSYNVKAPSSSAATNESSTGTGSGAFTINTTATVLPTTSTLTLATITNTTTGCSLTLNDAKIIDVDPTTVGGTVNTAATVCSGSNSGTLTLTGHTGSVQRWESSTNGGSTWSPITNTTTTQTYSNITQTTLYRAVVMSGVCTAANSASVTITVRDLPTASINNATICASTSTTLSVTVGNTFGESWTLTYTEGSTTRTLSGTGNGTFNLTTSVLTATTTYSLKSIVITTGTVTCSNNLTGVGVVTVNALPTVTHDQAPKEVCDGSSVDFTVIVSDVVAGQGWTVNYQINSGGINTRSGTGPGNFTITSPVFNNTTTTVRTDAINLVSITNTTTGCVRTATLSRNIDVYPKSVGGTTSATVSPLCANSSTTSDITVTGNVGKVVRWEYSDDNQATWTVLSNTSSTITVSNLSKTREYRAVSLSGPCASANSTITRVVVIPTVDAQISGSPMICAGKIATFNVLVSNIASTDNWSLTYRVNGTLQTAMTGRGPGNYPLTVGPPTTNTAGTIVVRLETITNTTFNCANNNLSSQAIATVNPNPVAGFNVANSCKDSVAVFNNTTTISSGTIADYNWNFGNGNFSKDGNPTHAYTATGNFSVTLLAISTSGCRDSITKTITVNPRPVAAFTFKNSCQDTAVKFVDGSSIGAGGSIRSYFWNFGDGTTANVASPTHLYAAAGTYTVTLTVVSNNGCAAVTTRNVTVYILPEPNFVANPVCQNSAMKFVNNTAYGVSYKWDFAGQGNSTSTDPTHTFAGFGLFNVSLTATSDKGCVKTLVKPVTVYANPIANFSVADVCIGEASKFINASAMPVGSTDLIQEYFWQFGDSTFSTGKDPLHTYAKDKIYSVSVRATSDKGCVNTVTKSAVVHPLPVVTFNAPTTKFCDGKSATIKGNSGMRQYEWTLNGTVVSTADSVVATKGGWYKLRIQSPSAVGGCYNEDSIFITVWSLPVADAGRDTLIDKGQSVVLNGRGAGLNGSYLWNPTTWLTNSINNIARPTSKPDENVTYILTVTDRNGCVDVDTVEVKVRAEFVLRVHNVITPNNDQLNDTWIIDNIEAYPNAEVGVFNRYGEEIFKTKGYLNQWDGTNKLSGGDPLPDGAYFYVITLEGTDLVYTGAINIIRSEF